MQSRHPIIFHHILHHNFFQDGRISTNEGLTTIDMNVLFCSGLQCTYIVNLMNIIILIIIIIIIIGQFIERRNIAEVITRALNTTLLPSGPFSQFINPPTKTALPNE